VVEVARGEKGAGHAPLLRGLLDLVLHEVCLVTSHDHEGIEAAAWGGLLGGTARCIVHSQRIAVCGHVGLSTLLTRMLRSTAFTGLPHESPK